MKTKFISFLLFIMFIPCLRAYSIANSVHSFDSLARQISKISFSQGTEAYKLLGELYEIANKQPDSVVLRARCLVLEAELGLAQGIYDSTLNVRIQKEMSVVDARVNSYLYGILNYSFSVNSLMRWNLSDAFTSALSALSQFRQVNDSLLIAKSLHVLGRISYYIKSFQLAEDYFMEARSYADTSENEYYQINSNIFITWVSLQRVGDAIDSLKQLSQSLDDDKFPGMLALTYMNIGVMYSIQNEREKAYQYYMLAKEVCKDIDNEVFSFSLYQNLGRYYQDKREFGKAYQHYLVAKRLADHSGNLNLISTSLSALATIYEKMGNIDSAYLYIREYNEIKASSEDNTNLVEAYRAYISVFLETSQKELIIKEQEVLLNKRRYFVTIISALGVIVLIASLLIILQQQKRHIRQQSLLKEAENRDLEERLQAKQEIEKLQKEKIAAQVRELTSYSLALSNKNNILQQIATVIDRDDRNATNEIRQVIKNNLNTDKVWKDFVVHFDKVHPDFFNRIKAIGTELSENDLRLCAYLRIGMTTKQIAQMLNVSPESIRMHRYRIKKKLNLSEQQNLDDFIRNI